MENKIIIKMLRERHRHSPRVYMMTNVAENEKAVLRNHINKLGAVYRKNDYFHHDVTHVICGDLKRTEPFLAALILGRWVVRTEYVTASVAAGKWLDEVDYEWSSLETGPQKNLAAAVKRNRWRTSATKEKLFANWQVAVVLKNTKLQNVYKRLLICGGARLHDTKLPVKNPIQTSEFLTYIFVDETTAPLAQPLQDCGVMCLDACYITDYIVMHPAPDPVNYLRHSKVHDSPLSPTSPDSKRHIDDDTLVLSQCLPSIETVPTSSLHSRVLSVSEGAAMQNTTSDSNGQFYGANLKTSRSCIAASTAKSFQPAYHKVKKTMVQPFQIQVSESRTVKAKKNYLHVPNSTPPCVFPNANSTTSSGSDCGSAVNSNDVSFFSEDQLPATKTIPNFDNSKMHQLPSCQVSLENVDELFQTSQHVSQTQSKLSSKLRVHSQNSVVPTEDRNKLQFTLLKTSSSPLKHIKPKRKRSAKKVRQEESVSASDLPSRSRLNVILKDSSPASTSPVCTKRKKASDCALSPAASSNSRKDMTPDPTRLSFSPGNEKKVQKSLLDWFSATGKENTKNNVTVTVKQLTSSTDRKIPLPAQIPNQSQISCLNDKDSGKINAVLSRKSALLTRTKLLISNEVSSEQTPKDVGKRVDLAKIRSGPKCGSELKVVLEDVSKNLSAAVKVYKSPMSESAVETCLSKLVVAESTSSQCSPELLEAEDVNAPKSISELCAQQPSAEKSASSQCSPKLSETEGINTPASISELCDQQPSAAKSASSQCSPKLSETEGINTPASISELCDQQPSAAKSASSQCSPKLSETEGVNTPASISELCAQQPSAAKSASSQCSPKLSETEGVNTPASISELFDQQPSSAAKVASSPCSPELLEAEDVNALKNISELCAQQSSSAAKAALCQCFPELSETEGVNIPVSISELCDQQTSAAAKRASSQCFPVSSTTEAPSKHKVSNETGVPSLVAVENTLSPPRLQKLFVSESNPERCTTGFKPDSSNFSDNMTIHKSQENVIDLHSLSTHADAINYQSFSKKTSEISGSPTSLNCSRSLSCATVSSSHSERGQRKSSLAAKVFLSKCLKKARKSAKLLRKTEIRNNFMDAYVITEKCEKDLAETSDILPSPPKRQKTARGLCQQLAVSRVLQCSEAETSTSNKHKTERSASPVQINSGGSPTASLAQADSAGAGASLSRTSAAEKPQLDASAYDHSGARWQMSSVSLPGQSCLTDYNPLRLKASLSQAIPMSLNLMISSCLDESYYQIAVELAGSVVTSCPPVELFKQMVIVLKEANEPYLVDQANAILMSWLDRFPPVTPALRKIYEEALSLGNWEVIKTVLEDAVQGADTKKSTVDRRPQLLLRLVVRILEKNFVHFVHNPSTSGQGRCDCIIIRCLWSPVYQVYPNSRTRNLLHYLERALKHYNTTQSCWQELFTLVTMAIQCCHLADNNWQWSASGVVDRCCGPLIQELTATIIESGVESASKLQLVLSCLTPPWLLREVVALLLNDYNDYLVPGGMTSDPITLKKIMTKHFFLLPRLSAQNDSNSVSPRKKVKQDPEASDENKPLEEVGPSLTAKKINKKNHRGETLLHVAAIKNKISLLRHMLCVPGVDVNSQDYAGWTPLHEACNHGNTECVKLLLKFTPQNTMENFLCSDKSGKIRRVNLHLTNHEGITPLHDAVIVNHIGAVRLLLKFGGSSLLKAKTVNGYTPLDLAVTEEMRQVLSRDSMNLSSSQESFCQDQDSQEVACIPSSVMYREVLESFNGGTQLSASLEEGRKFLTLLISLLKAHRLVKNLERQNLQQEVDTEENSEKTLKFHALSLQRHMKKITTDDVFNCLKVQLIVIEALLVGCAL